KSRASVVEGYVLDNGRQRGRHQGTENISCAGTVDSGSDDSSEGSDAKSEDDLEQKPSGKQELLNGRHYKICT
ncbi:hypothetical protein B296_00053835, partial [Ensete ventricosum]